MYSVNKSKPRTKERLDEFEKKGIPFGPITVPLAFPSQSWDEYGEFWKKHGPRDAEDE